MTHNVSACFYVYVVQEVQKLRASLVIKPSSSNVSSCERIQNRFNNIQLVTNISPGRHQDTRAYNHLPHASFFPHKLHHPTPLGHPPQPGALAPASPMLLWLSQSVCKLLFSFSPSPKAWPSRGDSNRDGRPFF